MTVEQLLAQLLNRSKVKVANGATFIDCKSVSDCDAVIQLLDLQGREYQRLDDRRVHVRSKK